MPSVAIAAMAVRYELNKKLTIALLIFFSWSPISEKRIAYSRRRGKAQSLEIYIYKAVKISAFTSPQRMGDSPFGKWVGSFLAIKIKETASAQGLW